MSGRGRTASTDSTSRQSHRAATLDAMLALVPMLAGTVLLAFFFAQIEIHIEGAHGWAANLPTWRIEHHWLLDVFWGSRPMTGYHAWVFPFIALFFHFPAAFSNSWSWAIEARIIACIMLFWLVEDFLWFVLNPAFGLARFEPVNVSWHKNWLWGAPIEYWLFAPVCGLMLWLSCRPAIISRRAHQTRHCGRQAG